MLAFPLITMAQLAQISQFYTLTIPPKIDYNTILEWLWRKLNFYFLSIPAETYLVILTSLGGKNYLKVILLTTLRYEFCMRRANVWC